MSFSRDDIWHPADGLKNFTFFEPRGKWFLERTFPVPPHLAELYGSFEWFLKRTFFVPQDSERLQKLQVFRTLRSTTNDEPKSGRNGSKFKNVSFSRNGILHKIKTVQKT